MLQTTPLVRLGLFGGLDGYAKLENTEPSGSIKYRAVCKMLDDAMQADVLRKGMNIIEISSGNTGIALAHRGRELGYRVVIITVKDATERSKELIKASGAELIEINGWFADGTRLIRERIEKEPGKWYWPNQVSNASSLASNYALGQEIAKQFRESYHGSIDLYVGSCETGSTLTGVARALKDVNPSTIVYRVVPRAEFTYPGVGEEGVSTVPLPLYDSGIIDRRIAVSETEAIAAALELKRTYGHSVGVSAGADFAAVKSLGSNEKGNCVIIFPDNGDRYKLE